MIRTELFHLRPLPHCHQSDSASEEDTDTSSYFLNLDPSSEPPLYFDQRKGDSPVVRCRIVSR